MKVTFSLAACLLAGSALAQSGAQLHASAATDAPRVPQPSRAAVDASAATDASKPVPLPASATGEASAATDAARSAASTRASAATDAPQRLIPQARKTKQPAAEPGKGTK